MKSLDCRRSRSEFALQHHFCNPHGRRVTVTHYPARCSKWNPIEHRLFGEVSRNWWGRPLETFNLILKCFRTATSTGLTVTSQFNSNEYATGIKISPARMKALNVTRSTRNPKWNYTIYPLPN